MHRALVFRSKFTHGGRSPEPVYVGIKTTAGTRSQVHSLWLPAADKARTGHDRKDLATLVDGPDTAPARADLSYYP